jgi:nucleoside-diphosphate-sugar epimerase
MPVIVVGADTTWGRAAVAALLHRDGEVRTFSTDPIAGADLKELGTKAAVGDVSDASHVGSAALQCFSAVLIADAAHDDRVRAFADDAAGVLEGWSRAIAESGVRRAIWVGAEPAEPGAPEWAVVTTAGRDPVEVAEEIAALDETAAL